MESVMNLPQKTRPILPSPGRLVSDGRFNLGTFKEPFREVNPLAARIGGIIPQPEFFKASQLKEWQHFALVNGDYYISLVLFNAKKLGFAQVCIYDRRDRSIFFVEKKTAPWSISIPMTLFDGKAGYRGRGFELTVRNCLDNGFHEIRFHVGARGDNPELSGRFTLFENLEESEPIVVCLPLGKQKALYSHKYICRLKGSLNIGRARSSFRENESYGLIDIHKGYYPYVMKWHWATGGAYQHGKLIGFNLTNNQVKDQERFNENCVWIDGRIHLLPPVKFTFDSQDLMKPWKIADSGGTVALIFTPQVIRRVDINAVVMANRYRAPFGLFSGSLEIPTGESIDIKDHFGMCEDMYMRG
jgi:hypothetical protein